jgi:hypothetical protein
MSKLKKLIPIGKNPCKEIALRPETPRSAYLARINRTFNDSRKHTGLTLGSEWIVLYNFWDKTNPPLLSELLGNIAYTALRSLIAIRPDVTYDTFKTLFDAKSAGYAGYNEDPWINFRGCTKFGVSVIDGLVTRLSDKVTRAYNLMSGKGADKVGEPLADTLMDIVAYCNIIITIIETEGMV